MNSSPSSDPTTDYARAVIDGTVPAGKWHRLSCARHLRDLEASAKGESDWVFRPELAEKAFGLFRLFRHYKGREWIGRPIALERWQQFIVGSLMGWVHRKTGLRRFRNAFVEVPRGNGKSTLAGGLLVIFGFFLGEGGAEAYSVATKKDQARISFQAGRQMLLRSPALKKHVEIGKYNVHNAATESKMEPLGADADTLDGLRPFIVVVDEVHKLPSGDLVDVMESGMGTRLDPLLFEITTAGDDDQSVYGQHALLSTRVLESTIDLPEWFAFIAAADPEDDWTQLETWKKANPNFGISVKPDFIEKEVRKALANPAEQAKVRRLYLGQKIQAVNSYFSVTDWQACPPLPDEALLRGLPCWIGLDLSSSIDITAAILVWRMADDEWAIQCRFWIPGENLDDRGHRDRLPYRRWHEDGWLDIHEGSNVIDFPKTRKAVGAWGRDWKVKQVCADPWQMREMGPALQDEERVPVLLVDQSFRNLSQPMKALQAKILERRIRHDHNPLMQVMVSNVVPRFDEKGNVLPSKKRSRGRIDGVQALLNVIASLPAAKPKAPSMYFMGGQ